MAEEDKTYCGQDDRSHVDARNHSEVELLARKFGVGKEDILDILKQVGNDPEKVEAYIKNKQNSY